MSLYTAAPHFSKTSLSLSTSFLGEGVSEHRLVGPEEKEKSDCINLLSFLSEQPLAAETSSNWEETKKE